MDLIIVDDDPEFRSAAGNWMTLKGHRVEQVADGEAALQLCEYRHFDVAVVDMNMPGLTGLEVLRELSSRNHHIAVVILTGQATVENAVEAMQLGACDYLTKPFPLTQLEQRCRLAAERSRLQSENLRLRSLLNRQRPSTRMIGASAAMQVVSRLIERVGPTTKTVLIQGERGTGKELAARLLQERSPRVDKPFVAINCAALPEALVESELFGYEQGAFADANDPHPGLFEVADGGTLFIDEIGELTPSLQLKLLRVLEEGSLRRIGSHLARNVDVRIIAATHRDLQKDSESGRFREDLYYRINVMTLTLPPLRNRQEDIPLLREHFLPPGWSVEPKACRALERYDWPGNVSQLIHVLQGAVILADDHTITLDDLPRCVAADHPTASAGAVTGQPTTQTLDELQRRHVLAVLQQERGNKARAARILGIHRRKLYRLLERYNVGPPEPTGDHP